MSRSLIVLAAGALAITLAFVFLLTKNPVDVALKDEAGPAPPTAKTTRPESTPELTRLHSLGVATEVAESIQAEVESNALTVSAPSIEYVPGRFDAPAHLQVAVYGAVSESRSEHVTFVDDMKCESGNCEIIIQIAGKSGISSTAADLVSRINSRLENNPLTSEIMVAVVSVSLGENSEGRAEFVTMLRPESGPAVN